MLAQRLQRVQVVVQALVDARCEVVGDAARGHGSLAKHLAALKLDPVSLSELCTELIGHLLAEATIPVLPFVAAVIVRQVARR